MAPILPGLSDDPAKMADVVRAARDAGATSIWTNVLYLRPGTREHFLENLARDWPALLPMYERLYAGRAYRGEGRPGAGPPPRPRSGRGARRGGSARAATPAVERGSGRRGAALDGGCFLGAEPVRRASGRPTPGRQSAGRA